MRRGSFGAASPVRRVLLADGLDWQSGQALTYECFTIPNAKCPVCGAKVYFYRSPYGGRVFFDELGPPWPKHPCTDNFFQLGKLVRVERIADTPRAKGPPVWKLEGWEPLLDMAVTLEGDVVLIRSRSADRQRRHHFGLRSALPVNTDGPMFCRALADGSGRFEIEIAFVPAAASYAQLVPTQTVVFPQVCTAEELKTWERALEGDPLAQNMVGMFLSFHNDTP